MNTIYKAKDLIKIFLISYFKKKNICKYISINIETKTLKAINNHLNMRAFNLLLIIFFKKIKEQNKLILEFYLTIILLFFFVGCKNF